MKSKSILSLILNLILAALAIITIIPFIWMLVSSFAPNSEIVKLGGGLFPGMSTFNNYTNIQEKFNFMGMFWNSLMISVTFAKFTFKGKSLLFAVVMSTMMLPWAVTIIPKYEMMVKFGWLDSYKSLIIPSMVSGFGIFMFKQSISGISNELIEAARVDGGSDFYIFHRLILPMSRNTISSLAIFQFLWSWEDFLWPYLMINTKSKQLLAVGLRQFNGQYGTDYGGLFAATTISIIPIVIVYIIFQKRFIAGIATGSSK